MAASSQEPFDEGVLDKEPAKRKAEAFVRMLEHENIGSESVDVEDAKFVVSHDVNGVWISTDGSGEGLHEGAYEALEEVNLGATHLETFTSGNPVEFLRDLKENEMEDQDLGLIGELGTVYENGDGLNFVYPEQDPRELFDIVQDLYDKAAEQNVKLMPQNDVSNVKLCFRPEAEHRSGLSREVKDQTIDEIWNELESYGGFEYDEEEGRIVFENSPKNTAILTDTLRYNFRFPGIRFEEAEDGRIAFYRDSEDDEEMSLREAHEFITEEVPEDAEYYENDDYGVDIVALKQASKRDGLRSFGDQYVENGSRTVYTHAGDMSSDVFTKEDDEEGVYHGEDEDVYHFPIRGEEAHRECLEKGIPHVPVEDGAEYARIMGEVADMQSS